MTPTRNGHDRVIVRLVILMSAAVLLWMARALLTGRIPIAGDLRHFHYPVRDFYAQALAHGQRFQWMPSLLGGFDVTGEGQLGGYHPLHWLLYAALPLDIAFNIETIVAYPCLFAGMWLFLRQWCDRDAAAFGAMLFTFCGFNMGHGVHPNLVGIIAHVPWTLWAVQHIFTCRSPQRHLGYVVVLALLTGSALLLGHPQAVWLSGLMTCAYAAMLAIRSPSPLPASQGRSWRAGPPAGVALGLLLGFAIGAVQLIATLHAAGRSVRAPYDPEYASNYSLPPLYLWQLLNPYLLWGRIVRWNEVRGAVDEFATYGGAIALVLAVWWLALPRRRQPDGRMMPSDGFGLCVAGFGLVGLWLALGGAGGLYTLQGWLPVVRQFRAPIRYVVFTNIALATLAALALMQLKDAHADSWPARRALWAPWAAATLSLLSAAWLVATRGEPVSRSALGLSAAAVGPALFLAATGLLTLAVRGRRWAMAGLVVLAAGDQALYGLGGMMVWQDFLTRQELIGLVGPADVRPPLGPSRLVNAGLPNLHALAGYRMLDGYVGLAPAKKLNYGSPRALRLAQVEYASALFQQEARLEEAEPFSDGWFKLPAPLPRVRLVTGSRVSRQPAVDLEQLDVTSAALVTRNLDLAGGPPGDVTLVHDEPGSLRVRTRSAGRQLLVVSESFDEGWVAAVDGVSTAVEEVNGDFLGCVVPAGEHDVRLEFRPARQTIGLTISLCGLLVAAALAAASIRGNHSGSGGRTGDRSG